MESRLDVSMAVARRLLPVWPREPCGHTHFGNRRLSYFLSSTLFDARTPVEVVDYRGVPCVRYEISGRYRKSPEVRLVSLEAWSKWAERAI
jgi:hypothetical protein